MAKMNKKGLEFEITSVGAIRTNCYIVKGKDNHAVIIDPGADAEAILAKVHEMNVVVDGILLTHGHFDHIMAVNDIRNATRAKVYASKAEKNLLGAPELNCTLMGAGVALGIVADVLLEDQEIFEAAGIPFQLLLTPGHTAGSACYYAMENDMLFCGDTVFLESVGRTDLPTGNGSAIISSLNDIILMLPNDVRLLPGHGPETSVLYEKNNNPYARGNEE